MRVVDERKCQTFAASNSGWYAILFSLKLVTGAKLDAVGLLSLVRLHVGYITSVLILNNGYRSTSSLFRVYIHEPTIFRRSVLPS